MASWYDSESITVASGTRRGSALSTPSTSVQMWISDAFSTSPKIEAEKSEPLRPSVVCTPSGVRAMKPGTMSVSGEPAGTSAAARWRDTGHCTAGPSGPHCTSTTSRASSHRTAPRRPRAREAAGEQPRRPQLAVAGDDVAGFLRWPTRPRTWPGAGARCRPRRRRTRPRTPPRRPACRSRRRCRCAAAGAPARAGAVGSWRSAADTRSSRPSVTPLHADRTTASGPGRLALDDVGHPPHAGRVGDARSPELEHTPRVRHDSLMRLRPRTRRAFLPLSLVRSDRPGRAAPPARRAGNRNSRRAFLSSVVQPRNRRSGGFGLRGPASAARLLQSPHERLQARRLSQRVRVHHGQGGQALIDFVTAVFDATPSGASTTTAASCTPRCGSTTR